MAAADDGTASSTEEDTAASAEAGATEDTAGTGTTAATAADDGTAPSAEEDAAASAEAGAAEDAAGADDVAAADDGAATAAGDDVSTGPETPTPEETGSADAVASIADDEPATEQGVAAQELDGAGDAAVGPTDEQAAAGEGTAEAEKPLVETRVVPDDPVEVTDEPPAVMGVEEETVPPEESGPAVTPPSFDTVRITPDGRAVIAGRAVPGAEITVRSESIDLGSETADLRGEWTLVPYIAIPPGDHEFSAIAMLPDGTQVESEQVLIVSIPDPDEDGGSVLALLMPREGEGKTTVLQKPEAKDEAVEMASRDDSATDDAPDADDSGTDPSVADETAPAAETDRSVAEDTATAAETDQAVTVEASGAEQAGEDEVASATPSEAEEEGPIVLDTVDYDDEGDITIAGKAEPETDLNVYIDDEHVGTVESDETGDWEVSPEDEVEPGSYTLRIDQVDPAGVVLARIETPLIRARPELLMLGDAIVVVQPGNSLWRIARRTMGGGIHFTEIYEANRSQIGDPGLIYPGQIFTVPGLE